MMDFESPEIPLFFGKPGCINNRKQKAILQQAGVDFKDIDLLSFAWTESQLKSFFERYPVADWLNPSAPRVKSGELSAKSMGEKQLLEAMVKDPILIRRPLIAWQAHRWIGFDWPDLVRVLPVKTPDAQTLLQAGADIETCTRKLAEHEP